MSDPTVVQRLVDTRGECADDGYVCDTHGLREARVAVPCRSSHDDETRLARRRVTAAARVLSGKSVTVVVDAGLSPALAAVFEREASPRETTKELH
jgi:hypothetical protein